MWPKDALEAVANKFLKELDVNATEREAIMEMCKTFHVDAADLSTQLRLTQGRVNYVTPTSYLELITMFTTLLNRQRAVVSTQQKRYNVRSPL